MVVYWGLFKSGFKTSKDNFEKHYDSTHIRHEGAATNETLT